MIVEPLSEHVGVTVRNPGGASLLDLDRDELVGLFKTNAGVLFAGFDENIETFETFTNRFTTTWIPYQGGAYHKRTVNPDRGGDIYSVNVYENDRQVTFKIDWHADMSYIKNGPIFLFFYLIHPASEGGETGLCDGVRVYEEMSARTRRLFEETPICYQRNYPDGNWQIRFQTDDLDEVDRFCAANDMEWELDAATREITTRYTVSALRRTRWGQHTSFNNSMLQFLFLEENGRPNSVVRLAGGERIPEDAVREVRELIDRLCVLRHLEKGQIVWVDNTRALHARMPFRDPERNLAQRLAGDAEW